MVRARSNQEETKLMVKLQQLSETISSMLIPIGLIKLENLCRIRQDVIIFGDRT